MDIRKVCERIRVLRAPIDDMGYANVIFLCTSNQISAKKSDMCVSREMGKLYKGSAVFMFSKRDYFNRGRAGPEEFVSATK